MNRRQIFVIDKKKQSNEEEEKKNGGLNSSLLYFFFHYRWLNQILFLEWPNQFLWCSTKMITQPWLRHIIIDIFGGNEATLSAEINEQKLHIENVTFFYRWAQAFLWMKQIQISIKKKAPSRKKFQLHKHFYFEATIRIVWKARKRRWFGSVCMCCCYIEKWVLRT